MRTLAGYFFVLTKTTGKHKKRDLLAGPGDSLSLGLDNEIEKTEKSF